MLNELIKIVILIVAIVAYCLLIYFFFKRKNRKDLFIRAYFITGGLVGLIYILLTIFLPIISEPIVPYMNAINYSDNAFVTADEIKTILNDQDKINEINKHIKDNSISYLEKLKKVEKELNNSLYIPLRNKKYHNNTEAISMINDIISYLKIEEISNFANASSDINKLFEEIIKSRKNAKIVKSLEEYIKIIEDNLATITNYKDNNLTSIEQITTDKLFDIKNSTQTKLYKKEINNLKKEIETIKKQLNVESIITNNHIEEIESMINTNYDTISLSNVDKKLNELDKAIKDKVSNYNITREGKIQQIYKTEIMDFVRKDKDLSLDAEKINQMINKGLNIVENTVIQIINPSEGEEKHNKYKEVNIGKIIYSNATFKKNIEEKLKSVEPKLNISVDTRLSPKIKNLIAINNINLTLNKIKEVINNSYVLETMENLKLKSVSEGVLILKEIYIYKNTNSLVNYLNKYSNNPTESLNKIKSLEKENYIKNNVREYAQNYSSLETILSVEPDFFINQTSYDTLTKDLLNEYKNAMIDSINKLSNKLKEDSEYSLFNEALLVLNEEDRIELIEKNSDHILSNLIKTEISYRPEYPFMPKKELSDSNLLLSRTIVDNLKKLIINSNINFPKRRIVFLSDQFKKAVYDEAVDRIKIQAETLKNAYRITPDIDLNREYKEMLSKNNDLKMSIELKSKIIANLNKTICEEQNNAIANIENEIANYLPLDKFKEEKAKNILDELATILSDKNLTYISDRITSLDETALFQKNSIPIVEKIKMIDKNDAHLQLKIITSFNAYRFSIFNTIVGFIMAIILWPLVSILFVSGGLLLTYSGSFIIYQPIFMIVLIAIGVITLILPFLLSIRPASSKKEKK